MDELSGILQGLDAMVGWAAAYKTLAVQHGFSEPVAERLAIDYHGVICQRLVANLQRADEAGEQ